MNHNATKVRIWTRHAYLPGEFFTDYYMCGTKVSQQEAEDFARNIRLRVVKVEILGPCKFEEIG